MKNKNLFKKAALAWAISMAFSAAFANPTLPTVVNGAVSFAQPNAQILNITNSPGSIINWHGFSIGAGEATRFIQQNATSAVLNRVTGGNPSVILGTLTSNGRVFLVNPNGIVFGGTSVVDVQGLVASTRDISNANFLNGNYLFENGGANSVTLQTGAQITTGSGGQVWLIANNINLEGGSQITAPQGQVTLAAGTQVQVGESSLGNMTFSVTTNDTNTLQSLGNITAESGAVSLFANHIVHTGTLDVSGPTQGGTIKLMGGTQTGSVNISGTLDASAPNGGNGGFIETSATSVNVSDTAKITTAAVNGKSGTWLIDPTDYTIAAVNPADGSSYMSNTTLSSSLGSGNVSIMTSNGSVTCEILPCNLPPLPSGASHGDIFVNDAVRWNANTTLTLYAHRNININADLTATGDTAGLTLIPNTLSLGGKYSLNNGASITLAGLHPRLTIAGRAYTVINSLGVTGDTSSMTLQGMNGNLAGYYALGSNIDATATSGWNAGAGFVPIGGNCIGCWWNNTPPSSYTGTFDGLGHTISNLFINRPSMNFVGLFGAVTGSTIRNVGLTSPNVTGYYAVGGLVGGALVNGTITNSYSNGSVNGDSYVGGLSGIGENISNSHSSSMVSGIKEAIGGLVGQTGFISNSYATGNVTGNMTSSSNVGGLVGGNAGGTVINSYATGSVSGNNTVGGLAGYSDGSINNSYSTGSVTGQYNVGGLVGESNGVWHNASISQSYSTGAVSGTTSIGGLVGLNFVTPVTNSYWDTQTSGQSTSVGGTGLTTAQMMTQASFGGFDFTNTWWMSEGNTRPFLRSEYSTTITNAHQLQLMAMNLSASYTLANNIDMGELTLASGMWSTTTGFVPIGSYNYTTNIGTPFTGTFDGLGHTIAKLTINRPSSLNVGLFGWMAGAISTVRNVGLTGSSITGGDAVGGLVGYNGYNSTYYPSIAGNGGTVSNSYVTGMVSGARYVGGLMGYNDSGTVSNSYASNSVSGNLSVGGLMGYNFCGIMNCGISNSYATGSVTGTDFVGGLLGYNLGFVSTSYAAGNVTGTNYTGGLIGGNDDRVNTSYWDTQTTGQATAVGRNAGFLNSTTGLTTAQMMTQANFTSATAANGNVNPNWDFANTWHIIEGSTYPLLANSPTPTITPPPTPTPPAAETIATNTLPTGANIRNGQVLFQLPSNDSILITNTPGAVIDWNTYSIGHLATVNYVQQDQYSAVLNRVVNIDSNNSSKIEGTLRSSCKNVLLSCGRVFLMNPNGITFGSGVTLDMQGLIASTMDISTENFLAGNYTSLSQAPQANVTSQYGYSGKILGLKNSQQSWLTTGNEVSSFFTPSSYAPCNGAYNGECNISNVILNNKNYQTIDLLTFIETGTGAIGASTLKSRMYGVSDPNGIVNANFLLSIVGGQYRDNVLQQAQLSQAVYYVDGHVDSDCLAIDFCVPTGWKRVWSVSDVRGSELGPGYSLLSFNMPSGNWKDIATLGFKAAVYYRPVDGRLSVAYAGTDPTVKGILTDGFLADVPLFLSSTFVTAGFGQYGNAAQFYNDTSSGLGGSFNKYAMQITGHSLGGSLAQYIGARSGAWTDTYNAPGFSTNYGTNINSAYAYLTSNAENSGAQIVNHVLSGDAVGNISEHVGNIVRINSYIPPIYAHGIANFATEFGVGNYGQLGSDSLFIESGNLLLLPGNIEAVIAIKAIEVGVQSADWTANKVITGVAWTGNLEQKYILDPYMAAINAAGNVGGDLIIKADNLVNSLISLFTSSPQFQSSSSDVNTFSNLTTANSTPMLSGGVNINYVFNATPQNTTVVQGNGIFSLVQSGI